MLKLDLSPMFSLKLDFFSENYFNGSINLLTKIEVLNFKIFCKF